jgi:asparagine synthase (glutamine-hydrolysing)
VIRHPYIAFLRRPRHTASGAIEKAMATIAASPRLSILHDSPTITVFAAPDSPHVALGDGHGIILGHLFARATDQAVKGPANHPLDAPAADFVRTYWGGYVALRSRNDAAEIVRDPSGAVPCYHVEIDDWHVVSSSPSLLVELGLVAVEIDWTIVAQALVYRDLRPARTALRGIAEIQPGLSARVFPPGLQTECVWSPWTYTAEAEEIRDSEEAIATVSQAVRQCIRTWGSRFDSPLAEISGGLDSSIVAAELARLDRPLQAITFKAVAGDPDETPYAAAVADHIGAVLTMLLPQAGDVDLASSAAADLARPNARSFAQALDRPEQAVAQGLGADAFFSGGGGDNVFCYLRSVAPVIDRLRRQGVGAWLFGTANDMASLTETSPWEVGYRTIRPLGLRIPACSRPPRQPHCRSRWAIPGCRCQRISSRASARTCSR